MSHNPNTDWAKNKARPNEIVYTFTDSEVRYLKDGDRIYEIKRSRGSRPIKRLLSESEMTVAEFDLVKQFSDDAFHDEEKNNMVETKRKVSLDDIANTLKASTGMYPNAKQQRHTMQEAAKLLDDMKLTPTQRRRFLLHCNGLTAKEIAALEGVSPQTVTQSIRGAKTKRNKILKKF